MKKIKTFKVTMLTLAIIISLFGVVAAPQNATVTKAASNKKVKLNKTKVTLNVGKTTTLKVKNAPKGKKITWSTNKKNVATVNQKGKVTAKKVGIAKITAKVAKKKCTCTVKVKKNNQTPTTNPDSTTPEQTPTTNPGSTTPEPTVIENNFSQLKNYILTNGKINSENNKFIAIDNIYDSDTSAGIVYDSSNKIFKFIFSADFASAGTALTLEISENDVKNGNFRYIIAYNTGDYSGACDASEILGTLRSDSTLNWKVDNGNLPEDSLVDLANSTYKLAYASWNLLLSNEVNLSMTDLGFMS